MPRSISSNLESIFADNSRDIEYLLKISFENTDSLYLATGELIKDLIDYENDIEGVAEIRQTIETPLDRVNIRLQNKDYFYDSHLAEIFDEWLKSEAVLYRRYFNADKTITEDVEVFRGGIEQISTDDANYTFSFQIVPDTKSKGNIVADRTLAPPCPFVFKDPQTCAYVGIETTCDHHLKTKTGCFGRNNTHHFGGTESRYVMKPSAPGTPSNEGDNDNCPALDQYVLARNEQGEIYSKLAAFVTKGDFIFNPVSGKFEKVKSAEIVADNKVYEVVCANGARSKASGTHPLIKSIADEKGTPIKDRQKGSAVLTWINGVLEESEIVSITPKGITSVRKIETEGGGHIYASGAGENKMIVCHNAKIIRTDVFN